MFASEEEQVEMQAFQNSLQEAIENEDFDSWKSLMESQLTKENFEKMMGMRQQQEEQRAEREQFCEENNCPNLEEGEFPAGFEGGMKHGKMRNFEMRESSFAKSSE